MNKISITTDRLILRPLEVEDAGLIYDAVVESWAELSKWMIWTLKPLDKLTIADYQEFCRRKHDLYTKREDVTFAVFAKDSGRFMGGCGLHKPDWDARTFSVGFWIRSSGTGQGYATEVVKGLSNYAFQTLDAHHLTSFHADGNDASRAVLLKTGFRPTGIAPQVHKLLDHTVDEHQYKLMPF